MATLVWTTLLTCVLMFLPELLLLSGGPAMAPPTTGAARVVVQLDGLGCEACTIHVKVR